MHQDKVRIIIRNDKKEGKRQEGVVVKVLERGMPEIVGTYPKSFKRQTMGPTRFFRRNTGCLYGRKNVAMAIRWGSD